MHFVKFQMSWYKFYEMRLFFVFAGALNQAKSLFIPRLFLPTIFCQREVVPVYNTIFHISIVQLPLRSMNSISIMFDIKSTTPYITVHLYGYWRRIECVFVKTDLVTKTDAI